MNENGNSHSPLIKKVVPPHAMPVVYRARGDIADVAAGLARDLQTPLVLAQPVCLAHLRQVRLARARRHMRSLKSVYLLEQVEVALIAPFQRLVRFFPSKDLCGALISKKARLIKGTKE